MAPASHALSARKLLARDWRGGELGVLLTALILAVGIVVGISAFVARLQTALEQESLRFLAADLVVSSRTEPPETWAEQAGGLDLATASTLAFPSMVFADNDAMHLASVKAVTDTYPLRGELRHSATPYGELATARSVPAPGEVWLAPRLFALLGVDTGDTVSVGEAGFIVSGALRAEPDAAGSMFSYGPRLMMNMVDIPATGVVQPGSRVNHRLLLGGNNDALTEFTDWIKPRLDQGQRLLGLEDSQPRINQTLDRARGFLLLAGSLAVVLAAAAIALAARRFSERHADYVAVMKSLGASTGYISRLYASSLFLLGVLATVLGCAVGWLIQAGFFMAFADQLPVTPGSSGISPYGVGAATALVCLGFFAWPPLRRLSQVPPLRVLRRSSESMGAQRPLDYVLSALAMVGLMLWYSGDVALTGGVVLGVAITVGVGFLLAKGLLRGSRKAGMRAGSVWRLALAGLQRRSNSSALQMVIFAIAIMLLLVLTIIRTSLFDQWQAQLPPGTPNHFVINVAPEERSDFAAFLATENISRERLYPMTRGRVMAVNEEALAERDSVDSDRRQRESNFTWSESVPEGNALIAGSWWSPGTSESLVSLEQDFAESIGAVLGDRLSLRIGADSLVVTVASIRTLDWQSMKPNFFMVFPREVLEGYPSMFMTSFFLPEGQKLALNTLVKEFPTVTVIELDLVIKEIRGIIDQVGVAIEMVLGVIVLAGALVLVAGVQASVDVRIRESALLRALGARKGLLLGALWIEFTVLGLMSGLLAVLGAEAAAALLQARALDLSYSPSYAVWPLGLAIGGGVIGIVGVWSCRRVASSAPLTVLREV
ncbi:ABC-type transport system, permease component [Luminiphilus syltensis NOR5-1B]|uniref:ABC-type transport system, permease component n=1 Tax=Luminiphilus syltensis NOR5-1B TaxID=565045 RepID=B8KS83_9GAMM|nr:FtsX-like permease family protein [Luminiphilus syltensis]EED35340.1 ABC-type transport system, permease component [Luminiphilus syltensis NOR5-1B]